MECLDEETVLRFVCGQLDGERAQQVDTHVADCTECRELIAHLAHSLIDCAEDESTNEASGASARAALSAVHAVDGAAGRTYLQSGEHVGRYVIDKVIGAGGMGVVYLAHDPTLNRRITLKLLRDDRNKHRGAQASLLREAQAMAQLSHTNVVAVYDAGTFGSQVFVAMEFVEGDTLQAWIERHRGDWRSVLSVFIDAGRGLTAAHAVGIVHRDFKPDNVLVGKDGRVCVTDFGLARPVGGDGERSATGCRAPPTALGIGTWP
jgi:RIO-like serine/threonine protein kinase